MTNDGKGALFILAMLCAALGACTAKPDGGAENAAAADLTIAPSGLRTVPLTISANGTTHVFQVEVAVSPEEQARGLMFRKSLADDAGMVFPMDPARTASFWMKNTVIPLDILFIRTDGSIAHIAANAQPYDRTPLSAGIPVAAVLELRGGRAAELGIRPGDRVRWGDCSQPANALAFCP